MVSAYEITCIKRQPNGILQNDKGKIIGIGYRDTNANITKISVKQAIQMIQSGQCTFYVENKFNKSKISVEVVDSKNGASAGILGAIEPYLRTAPNESPIDNLEQLPEC